MSQSSMVIQMGGFAHNISGQGNNNAYDTADDEKYVIGCILLGVLEQFPAMDRACEIIELDDFLTQDGKDIFAGMLALHERKEPVELWLLISELKRQDKLEKLGGEVGLQALLKSADTSATAQHVERYAHVLAEKSARRSLAQIGEAASKKAVAGSMTADQLAQKTIADIDRVNQRLQARDEPFPMTTLREVAQKQSGYDWIWEPWICKDYVHLLPADGGMGKTALMQYLADVRYRGGTWPDGQPCDATRQPMIYLDYDAFQQALVVRAEEWGLTPESIYIYGSDGHALDPPPIDDPEVVRRAGETCKALGADVICIDPLGSAHTKRENTAEMDKVLQPWSSLARHLHIAVLATHHLTKPGEHQLPGVVTKERVRGHTSIYNRARIVWGISPAAPGSDTRELHQIKNNIALQPEPIGFRLDDEGIVFVALPDKHAATGRVHEATEFLREQLRSPKPSSIIRAEAAAAGFANSQLYAARKHLGVISLQDPKEHRQRIWSLPALDI